MKKISIVIAYYNRKRLLYNTLKILEKNDLSDLLEIIIVDDASDDKNRIDDFHSKFTLNIKVIRIEPEQKTYINPSIPYNIGFKFISDDTDFVIIQNPECIHHGDIIKYTLKNLKENIYISFGAYSIDEYKTKKINKLNFDNPGVKNTINQIIKPLVNRKPSMDGVDGWYNHSVYKNKALHFCSAITKKDLDKVGGFDVRFANGIGFDDNDFVFRIISNDIDIKIVDDPFVIHQYHGQTNYSNFELFNNNLTLFESLNNNTIIPEKYHHINFNLNF